MNNREIKAPIGLLIIAIFGIAVVLNIIKTLQDYTNYDISYNEKK